MPGTVAGRFEILSSEGPEPLQIESNPETSPCDLRPLLGTQIAQSHEDAENRGDLNQSSKMKLFINSRGGKFLGELELPNSATIVDLKEEFFKKFHYYPERQWFNKDSAKGDPIKDGTLLANGLKDGSTIVFKDMGVQISWRLVFVLEYLGPLLIFPMFYFLPHLIYSDVPPNLEKTLTQKVAFALTIFHYAKREVETLFVHRFSSATMPIMRLPINCFHYWIIFAALVGYFLFHPRYVVPFTSPILIYSLAGIMLVFEFLNFQTHLVLRQMRPRNTKIRGIPHGWGFDVVSCANYLWEIAAWLAFAIMTCTLTVWIFWFVATGQMLQWALKRHSNYRKEFPDYPRNRKAMFPFIL